MAQLKFLDHYFGPAQDGQNGIYWVPPGTIGEVGETLGEDSPDDADTIPDSVDVDITVPLAWRVKLGKRVKAPTANVLMSGVPNRFLGAV